ncbi:hypothetical protein GQ607_008887 [Colletotrichum asianum]|uniref:Uncharacterized protein n=1 Tax=Colletotrichum asianum TaxID=702518 RepID=A0A8H3WCY4_9PEZI|nr:hypothetical protein GQ607_008887 [Colletotrichum asianum]
MSSQPSMANVAPQKDVPHADAHDPSSPAAEAARVIERTNSWKPSFERRQSWNKEDQKRELQMSHIEDHNLGSREWRNVRRGGCHEKSRLTTPSIKLETLGKGNKAFKIA